MSLIHNHESAVIDTTAKELSLTLTVYGTVYHMNHGNPFNLKALVDKWPDFNTVVVRPQEQDMADDLDNYTNTYQVYSKDPQNCQEFLGSPEVMNWKQHLQIQSSQSCLNEAIKNLANIQSFQANHSENILFVESETIKTLFPSLLDTKNLPPGSGKPKAINQDMFKLSSLDVTHAAMVNKFWLFGGNERSQRFIERCIKKFPSSCVLGPEGTPASWTLMDQTGEIRMGGTMPEYRAQGLMELVEEETERVYVLCIPDISKTFIMKDDPLCAPHLDSTLELTLLSGIPVLEEMFYLQGSQMLRALENSLKRHLPESLKVYGTVFHMNQGNPFKVKAMVDKWPDFNTVVIRPQEQ
ncbi:hypothetical protein STEG23_029270, partial [Scotinomys teguina]